MRQYILSLLVVLFLALPATAQKGFHIGVQGAALNTYIVDKNKYGDVAYNYKPTVKPMFGIEAGDMFTDMVGVQVEADYTWMGQKYTKVPVPFSNTLLNENFNLNYFSVPVLLKYTGGDYKSRFTAMVGPQFNFLTGATASSSIYQSDNSVPVMATANNVNVTNHFNSSDMGLLVAAGGDITVHNNMYLSIELRLYYGFNTINKNKQEVMLSNSTTTENEQLQNVFAGVCIGIHNLFRKQ
jgi:hypothetical protein